MSYDLNDLLRQHPLSCENFIKKQSLSVVKIDSNRTETLLTFTPEQSVKSVIVISQQNLWIFGNSMLW